MDKLLSREYILGKQIALFTGYWFFHWFLNTIPSFEQMGPDGKANHGLKCYPGPVLTSILQLTPDLLRAVFDIWQFRDIYFLSDISKIQLVVYY